MPSPAVLIAGIVAIIATMIFVATTTKCCTIATVDGFADVCKTCTQTFNQCPFNSTAYYDKSGELRCCTTEVNGHSCSKENIVCSFVPNQENIPICSVLTRERMEQDGARMCPRKFPTYYKNFTTNQSGCTNGPLNASFCAPLNSSQPGCKFGDGTANSCEFLRGLEEGTEQLGDDSVIVQQIQNSPQLQKKLVEKVQNDSSFRDIFMNAIKQALAVFKSEIEKGQK